MVRSRIGKVKVRRTVAVRYKAYVRRRVFVQQLAGVPLERVSILLGHSTIKVTERHYAPWIQKRQQQLEADLRAMWSNDEQGTKEVQSQNGRPN
jgi:intergrase/recombinase